MAGQKAVVADPFRAPTAPAWLGRLRDWVDQPRPPDWWTTPVEFPGKALATEAARSALQWLTNPQTAVDALATTGVPGGPPRPPGVRAFHGSPHDFDRFDFSRIGSGQGAQTYGHGLYFAEREPVARTYRNDLSPRPEVLVGGEPLDQFGYIRGGQRVHDPIAAVVGGRLSYAANRERQFGRTPDVATLVQNLRNEIAAATHNASLATYNQLEDQRLMLDRMMERGITLTDPGRMYEVNLGIDPARLLDYDRRLGEQPHVIEALRKLGLQDLYGGEALGFPLRDPRKAIEFPLEATGGQAYVNLARAQAPPLPPALRDSILADRIPADERAASAALARTGIPGLRYLDQYSRGSAPEVEAMRRRLGDLQENLTAFDRLVAAGQARPSAPQRQHFQTQIDLLTTRLAQLQEPTRNYVIWDPSVSIDILRKYGLLAPLLGGGTLAGRQPQPSSSRSSPPPVLAPSH
jgi:hypothetical protein